MQINQKRMKTFTMAACFMMASIGSKISLAYWASAISGNSTNPQGSVVSGTWDRYSVGTPISSCSTLKSKVLSLSTNETFYLTQNINCSSTTSPTSTTTEFSGTLYGNGYTISNFNISSGRRGLFYYLKGAKIQNLILNNIIVGSTKSRSTGATGVLASTNSGNNTLLSKIRVYNSAVYTSSLGSCGGIIGRSTASITLSNVMAKNLMVNNTSTNNGTGTGGIIGRSSAAANLSDIFFEGTVTAPYNSGGIIGLNESTGVVTVNRAITYSNTTLKATSANCGGVVGKNLSSNSQSLNDVFFTGPIYCPSKLAGTLYTGTTISYTNAWSVGWSWDNNTTIAYTAMTGTSAPYPSHFVSALSDISDTWWKTNIPNIGNSPRWTYDASSFLFRLKPLV